MESTKIVFRILRYKPGTVDPPQFQNFTLIVHNTMSVLDCLERIRLEQDPTLMYRHSCHHSACGTCACKINGRPHLSCITNALDLNCDVVTLAALDGFKRIGDLVIDMRHFYEALSEDWTNLKTIKSPQPTRMPAGIKNFQRFEDCIECAACVAACPVTSKTKSFIGPAALAALHNQIGKTPSTTKDLLSLAGGLRGERWCEMAGNCSRVCPTGVYPAKHILELRKLLAKAK